MSRGGFFITTYVKLLNNNCIENPRAVALSISDVMTSNVIGFFVKLRVFFYSSNLKRRKLSEFPRDFLKFPRFSLENVIEFWRKFGSPFWLRPWKELTFFTSHRRTWSTGKALSIGCWAFTLIFGVKTERCVTFEPCARSQNKLKPLQTRK